MDDDQGIEPPEVAQVDDEPGPVAKVLGWVLLLAILAIPLAGIYFFWTWAFVEDDPVPEQPSTIFGFDIETICRKELGNRAPAFDYPVSGGRAFYNAETEHWTAAGPVEYQGRFRATYSCTVDATPYSDGTIKYRVVRIQSPGANYP